MVEDDITPWENLTKKRKEVLKKIYDVYGTDNNFETGDIDEHLENYEVASRSLLNNLSTQGEDGYLNKQSGGKPFLIADIPKKDEENKTKFNPEEQEKLAKKMTHREELESKLERQADQFNWVINEERKKFCNDFNECAEEKYEDIEDKEPIHLIPKHTKNKYRLNEDGAEVIEENIQNEEEE